MTTLTAATPTMSGLAGPGPAMRAAPPASGLSGADILAVIRQRLVLIIALWVFFLGITVAVTFLWAKYYPKYSADALIWVESVTPIDVMNPLARKEFQEEQVQRMLQDQAVLVKSPEVMFGALQDSELRATSWFTYAQEKEREKNEDPMDLLSDIVGAAPIRDTNYVRVSASWRVADEVAKIVNVVVDKYEQVVERQQKENLRKMTDAMNLELERAKKSLDGINKEVDAIRATDDVLGDPNRRTDEGVLTLQALVTELEVETLARKTNYEALAEAKPEDLPITADLQALIALDPMILNQERQYQDAEQNLLLALAQFGKNHRVVKSLEMQRNSAADRLNEETAKKIIRYKTEQLEQVKRGYLDAVTQLNKVQEKLLMSKAEQSDREKKFATYLRRLEDRDMQKAQYEKLLEKKDIMEMTIRQPRSVQIEVRSKARPPRRMSSPRWEYAIPVGALLGLGASIGIALLLEISDKSVRTPRDLLKQQIPVLGTIPSTSDDEIEIERVETAALDAPHSIIAEAFRNLRANLFFSAPPEQQGVILVTSPSGGNGKTTVATNLAISIALSGRRVLLVDANFRRPSLPRIFPDMKAEGLSNVLIGQGRLDTLVSPTAVPGLDVLSPGPTPPNPAELLGSSYLRDMVVDARARYDQVIFDGPPFLLVSDAMVLAGAVDGVLLVCQYRKTSRGALQRTHTQLESANVRIFGAVLNQVETRAGGYFRKSYREFYEYQSPDEEGGERAKLDVSQMGQLRAASVSERGATPPGSSGLALSGADSVLGELADGSDLSLPGEGGETSPESRLGLDEPTWPTTDLDKEIEQLKGDLDEFKLDDGLSGEAGDKESEPPK